MKIASRNYGGKYSVVKGLTIKTLRRGYNDFCLGVRVERVREGADAECASRRHANLSHVSCTRQPGWSDFFHPTFKPPSEF